MQKSNALNFENSTPGLTAHLNQLVTVDQTWSNRLSHTTPFKNLFLTGHWTNPGPGICAVVSSGWRVANMILNN